MTPVYNRICVLILVLTAFLSTLLSAILCMYLFNYNFIISLGIAAAGLAVFIGQYMCFFPSDGDNLWKKAENEDEILAILNKQIVKTIVLSPFNGIIEVSKTLLYLGKIGLAIIIPVVIFGLVIAVGQIIMIGAVAAMVLIMTYIPMSIIRTMNNRYIRKNIKSVVCDKCGTLAEDYHFICPNCNIAIGDLNVSKYGAFTKLCPNCKHRLYINPSMKFKQYAIESHNCGDLISTNGSQPITISMAGSVGSGKTSFIRAFISYSSEFGMNRFIINDPSYNSGTGTPMGYINPTVLEFNDSRLINPKRLFFYDINGMEFISASDNKYFQKQYTYNTGIIFLIDGESIEDHDENRLKQTEDTFEGFMTCLKNITRTDVDKKFDIPLAMVITKTDMMSDVIDEHIAGTYLSDCGLDNMINTVEREFEHYKFFTCNTASTDTVVKPVKWITGFDCPELSKLMLL